MSRKVHILVLAAAALLPISARAQVIDHSNPTSNNDLVANQSYPWGPVFMGGVCRLTDKGTSEICTIFYKDRVNVAKFKNSFEFQIISGGPFDDATQSYPNVADGMTFTLQATAVSAIGLGGGNLGYGTIDHSVAVKFDCAPNPEGDPSGSCTGLFVNGQAPFGGIDLLPAKIDLRSQHPFRVEMDYDHAVLRVRITDLATAATAVQTYNVDIPATIGSPSAFVGFTAATGLGSSAHDLHSWYWNSPPFGSTASKSTPREANVAACPAPSQSARGKKIVAPWPTFSLTPAKPPRP
ncbi:hypothetical protein CCAX7_57840 [Capsulimonas corticalis]|uniref:Uncharacterized protein n=1 Tax=Capsulimonas corticalis TaxID=2219043 RepID=A0A402D037_9BACT|nr:L-type lectin-domain containing protein [Capsulimonas corticalis]BDI33733.1 hypothetical protein CCAX7_57840 [Capsulimonas corticalis]